MYPRVGSLNVPQALLTALSVDHVSTVLRLLNVPLRIFTRRFPKMSSHANWPEQVLGRVAEASAQALGRNKCPNNWQKRLLTLFA